jgi:hypothetical protein
MADAPYWEEYTAGGAMFYFQIDKTKDERDPMAKVAIALVVHEWPNDTTSDLSFSYEVFDAEDKSIGIESIGADVREAIEKHAPTAEKATLTPKQIALMGQMSIPKLAEFLETVPDSELSKHELESIIDAKIDTGPWDSAKWEMLYKAVAGNQWRVKVLLSQTVAGGVNHLLPIGAKDPDPQIRLYVLGLINADGVDVERAQKNRIFQELINDPDENVRYVIVYSISKDWLIHFIDDPSKRVRYAVAKRAYSNHLREMLKIEKDESVRREIERTLKGGFGK